ncbi:MAG: RtcB family protein [Desulfobulbus sp.]|nr:RtcB family protein [Desulfobulbus sp.]
MLEQLDRLASEPHSLLIDELFAPLAEAVLEAFPTGIRFIPRVEPAPWKKWGDITLEEPAIDQMQKAAQLPVAMRGALMPDAHPGYGLPIGGVLAVKDAVIPYAVGVDIACRMRMTVLDLPVVALQQKHERLIRALEEETRFGLGAAFEKGQRRDHAVMEEDWAISPRIAHLKDKAWKQLGTSGGGNHFVEFGELILDNPALGLEKGSYLALLSHSGSRGSGEQVAEFYSKLAMGLRPYLPQGMKHLAWLELASAEGREYWAAMQLMGKYAAANHELIHRHVLANLGAEALARVENHHNFAWQEEHGGEVAIVHRKGATPAGKGVLGIIPGSMASPGFVVCGKGNAGSLNSCSHGAGRLMSRTAAVKNLDRDKVRRFLEDAGIHLISGGLDEAPMAYKDIHAVMAAQGDLVDILACFQPRLVKMAPDDGSDRKNRYRKKQQ